MWLPTLVLAKSPVSSTTATANSNNLYSRSYFVFFGAADSKFASLTENAFGWALGVRRLVFGVFLLITPLAGPPS